MEGALSHAVPVDMRGAHSHGHLQGIAKLPLAPGNRSLVRLHIVYRENSRKDTLAEKLGGRGRAFSRYALLWSLV